MCDLTFSISLQKQAERARASSGTVNKVMYPCGVWQHVVTPGDMPSLPKGCDQLSPLLGRACLLPTHLSSVKLLKAKPWVVRSMGIKKCHYESVGQGSANPPRRPGRCHAQCPAPGPAQTPCSRRQS